MFSVREINDSAHDSSINYVSYHRRRFSFVDSTPLSIDTAPLGPKRGSNQPPLTVPIVGRRYKPGLFTAHEISHECLFQRLLVQRD